MSCFGGGSFVLTCILYNPLGFGLEGSDAVRERVVRRVVGPWALDPAAVYELPSGHVAALGAQTGQAPRLARIGAVGADRILANTAVSATQIAKFRVTNNTCYSVPAPLAVRSPTYTTQRYVKTNFVNRTELVFFSRAAGIQATLGALPKDIFTVQAERLGAEVAVAALANGAALRYSACEVGYGRAGDLVSVLAPVILLAYL